VATCRGLKGSLDKPPGGRDFATRTKYRVRSMPFGAAGSDAYPCSESGLKAVCVLPLRYPQQIIQFYHQPSDNYDLYDSLALEPFLITLRLAVRWARHSRMCMRSRGTRAPGVCRHLASRTAR
jgi:hypothetical protein